MHISPSLSEPSDCSDIWLRVSSCSSCSYNRRHSHSGSWSSSPLCGRACVSPGSPWTSKPFRRPCIGTPFPRSCREEGAPPQHIRFQWNQEIQLLSEEPAEVEEVEVWLDRGSSPPWRRKMLTMESCKGSLADEDEDQQFHSHSKKSFNLHV